MRDAGPAYIDNLVQDLHKHIPRGGVIHDNPNMRRAFRLGRLADNDIHFSKEQIDGIVSALDNPDPTVAEILESALTQVFGISFVNDKYGFAQFHTSEKVRSVYRAAWQKFWKQNRDRYGRNLPLIINDLSLDAQCHRVRSCNRTGDRNLQSRRSRLESLCRGPRGI